LGYPVLKPANIGLKSGEPFAFAGLWEIWKDPAAPEAEPLRTYTILTCDPNALTATLHNRMPVIVPRDRYTEWLSSETPAAQRASLLQPYPEEEMMAYPISPKVNSPKNVDPSVVEPQ
jgi:putative SOS response-associated peptidase YedK